MRCQPKRTCVGCKLIKSESELVRFYLDQDNCLARDVSGKSGGRGVYFCRCGQEPDSTCLNLARNKNVIKKIFGPDIRFPEKTFGSN